jgi:hypothetical protein
MGLWKTITSNSLRVYFKVVSGGNLVVNLDVNFFDVIIINPNDTDSFFLDVYQSSQLSGVYYTDVDMQFLLDNGAGMYGLSIGIHKPPPNRIDDEVLYPIEVTEGDLTEILNIVNATNENVDELWKLHGLDPDNELTVDQNGRSVDDITQVFTKIGDQLKVNRN